MNGSLQNRTYWLIGGFSALAFGVMLSLEFADEEEVLTPAKILVEVLELGLLVGCGAVVVGWLLGRISAQESKIAELESDVGTAIAAGNQWREPMREPMQLLSSGVQQQFHAWGMSEAEQDIGFLILKGFAFKEIASVRNTSEATVRQQAASIYRKASLSGRACFSAYFFEDLRPTTQGPAERPLEVAAGGD